MGGSIGGSILAVGGEQGVARVGIWERSMNTPTLADVVNTCGAPKSKTEHLPMFFNTCGALKSKTEHLPMFF